MSFAQIDFGELIQQLLCLAQMSGGARHIFHGSRPALPEHWHNTMTKKVSRMFGALVAWVLDPAEALRPRVGLQFVTPDIQ
tara:strand:+ start:72 stop:314 length:243 start_codon:yes stop_codon:yes gene_type:complete